MHHPQLKRLIETRRSSSPSTSEEQRELRTRHLQAYQHQKSGVLSILPSICPQFTLKPLALMEDSSIRDSIILRKKYIMSQQTPQRAHGSSGVSEAGFPLVSTARYTKIQSGIHPYLPTTPEFLEASQDSFRQRRRHRSSTVTRFTILTGGDSTSGQEETDTEDETHLHQEHQQNPEVTQFRQHETALFRKTDTSLQGQQQPSQGQQ